MPFLTTLLVAFQIMQYPMMPVSDADFIDSPPAESVSYAAATRFLEQATFGPSPASIQHLAGAGMDRWLQEQFAATPSPIPDAPAGITNLSTAQQNFFDNAINRDDQLRQRVAFALGQIWVISGVKINRPEAFIPYLRLLQKDAFGNYYDLMYDVTLSPAMGHYLDMVNNDKPNPVLGRSANENYARELLQLFTTGLEKLNGDGSVVRDEQGQPVPAYDQEVIEELARAFTGWTYPPAPGQVSRLHNPAYWDGPMVAFESNHDTGAKVLLDGRTLPAGRTAENDLRDSLRNIFEHPNVGPFIGKQLIQHLVTSNPSGEYVSRVAAAFDDNGLGVRGDMQAVIRAILLDPEARQFDNQVPPETTGYGHLREPALFITNLLRSLRATVTDQNNLAGFSRSLGQNLYYPPTVFNYFAPGYEVPGAQTLGPEFQILSPANSMARVNLLNRLFFGTLGGGTTLDLTPLISAASNPTQLVDSVDATLLHGTMSEPLRTSILKAVSAASDNPTRARTALYLAAASGQYQVEQ